MKILPENQSSRCMRMALKAKRFERGFFNIINQLFGNIKYLFKYLKFLFNRNDYKKNSNFNVVALH